jgi:hypothetical protein
MDHEKWLTQGMTLLKKIQIDEVEKHGSHQKSFLIFTLVLMKYRDSDHQ